MMIEDFVRKIETQFHYNERDGGAYIRAAELDVGRNRPEYFLIAIRCLLDYRVEIVVERFKHMALGGRCCSLDR